MLTKTKIALASVLVLGSATFASADETLTARIYHPSAFAKVYQNDARGAYAQTQQAPAVKQSTIRTPLANQYVW